MALPEPRSNPSADSSGNETFADRKRRELAQERGVPLDQPPAIPDEVDLATRRERQDAHQPLSEDDADLDHDELDDEDRLLDEAPEDSDDDDGVDLQDEADEGEEESEEASYWRQKAEEAEELRQEMQTDYTRKTQTLSQQRRQLEQDIRANEGVLRQYVENANQFVSQWDSVNWSQLQQTLDPAEYQKRVDQYRNATQLRDRALGQHQQFVEQATQVLDQQKQAEAEVSRDILKGTIPGWSNELYGQLAEFATDKLGISQERFGDITEHWVIELIYDKYVAADPENRILGKRKSSKRPSSKSQRKRSPQERTADGRFASVERRHRESPGDRNASREYFRQKLARERRGR